MNYLLVTILEPKRVVVELKGMKDKETKLTDLGFSKKNGMHTACFESEKEQLHLIKNLIEMDALFSYGQGWAPSQVMSYLKEQGKMTFPYKEILWRSPDNFEIIEYK
ncbi:hypothetical protein WKG85_12495 [Pantoea agglomerans]|uniref:hypothetical protein n=1 Tax=Enterobacter agglomerans TaxID=549 RepID=UPI003C797E24